GIRTVKAFRQEETEIKRTNSLIDEFFRLKYKSTKINSLASPIMEILSGVAIATVIWYAARDSLSNIQSQGELVSFIAALIMLARPLKSLNGLNEAIQSSLAAAERFYTMIDSKPKQEPKTGNKPLEVKKGNVEFHKLSFSYVEGQNTLKNISLSIPAGKKVAIVGHSGSGKSTIVNLLLRFYDPDSGKVLIDGQDIREASLESVRGNISLVSQDVFLFSDSMKQNIAYGDSEASDEEIIQAAKDGGAHEFISKMTHGYDTPAGETGILLSGGQRQRIAIARAFLKNSPILVLDEATSSLDPIAEQKIQKTLDKLTKGRTTIIIAHRLSTVRDADIIYVMENGEVVESGKHAELMKKSAIYSNLFSAA
ncbi:MAG: ABC transporter permease, partial [Alphaproteobacteria bacterium CG11_big_fil_rev_8_21_14_0_20_44_7]